MTKIVRNGFRLSWKALKGYTDMWKRPKYSRKVQERSVSEGTEGHHVPTVAWALHGHPDQDDGTVWGRGVKGGVELTLAAPPHRPSSLLKISVKIDTSSSWSTSGSLSSSRYSQRSLICCRIFAATLLLCSYLITRSMGHTFSCMCGYHRGVAHATLDCGIIHLVADRRV
jgi:hypothetical protein